MPDQPDITISIIDTDNREQTLQCLKSIFESTRDLSLAVFVVDNFSSDGSGAAIAARFPRVKVLRNERRLGFSSNNNQVFARATGRYLMLLNDDTVVGPGAFDAMVDYADTHAGVGVVGASLRNPDGSAQRSFDRFPGLFHELFRPLSCQLRPFPVRGDEPCEVDYVSGACMMVRSECAAQVGLLDPAFDPIYAEEADWCFRIRQAGWKVVHLPRAQVTHLGSQTMNRAGAARAELLYRKKTLFLRKHRGATVARIYKAGLLMTSLLKLLVARDGNAIARHWQVARRCLSF